MMPLLLDFWFDFASSYSYPAAMQIVPLAWQSGVIVRFRPLLLGPLFEAQGWPSSPFNLYPTKRRYTWRDLERTCFDLDLPFRRPEPFPQNSWLAARVALVGLSSSWSEELCRGVFRADELCSVAPDVRHFRRDDQMMFRVNSYLDADPVLPASAF